MCDPFLFQTTVPVAKGVIGTVNKSSPTTVTGQPTNRVVLVQGPQGQLILPSNLQGRSLKMISVQPQQQQQPK